MISPPSTTCEKVYDIVRKIPTGKVSTYSAVARAAGIGSPRVVGNCLHKNPYPHSVPCHRVVNVSGHLAPAFAFGGSGRQRQLLESEGVVFQGESVDLSLCLHRLDNIL